MGNKFKHSEIKPGGQIDLLRLRIERVLNKETKGVVLVFDESYMDFAHGVSRNEFVEALLSLAEDVALYPGD